MRLVKVELKRLRSRRLVWVTAAALVLMVAMVSFGAFMDSRPLSDSEVAQQEEWFQESLKMWKEEAPLQLEECKSAEAAEREAAGDTTIDWQCEDSWPEPTREDFFGWQMSFTSDASSSVRNVASGLVAAVILIGASLIAAELNTGALGNWLTFEPRRTRVFFSKVGAVALGVIPITAALIGLLIVALLGVYTLNDAFGTDTGWAGELVWTSLRVLLMAVICAVLGFALGMLTRHTAAALGSVMGYLVVFEMLLYGQIPRPLTVGTNFEAWLSNGTTYSVEKCTPIPSGGVTCDYVDKTLSFGHSAVFFAVLTLVFVVTAWLVFRRRDVN